MEPFDIPQPDFVPLAQACQVLWLVPFNDACDREHVLTIGPLLLALIAADLLNVAPLTVRDVRALSALLPARRSSGVAKRAA